MAARLQHTVLTAAALPGTFVVTGWGAHRYRPDTPIDPADVSVSLHGNRAAPGAVAADITLRLKPPAARALAAALVEAADAAEAAPPTEEDPRP